MSEIVGLSEGIRLVGRTEAGRRWPTLVWAPGPGWRMISTAVAGGGLGERRWWLNTQVDRVYHHPEPAAHVGEIAVDLSLTGPGVEVGVGVGVGMLTAADVRHWTRADDDGVIVAATVGLGLPVFAAAAAQEIAAETRPGTINLLVIVPVALSDAALVNTVITATEAKTQALFEAGIPGTGTSSDALCIACPIPSASADAGVEEFGGPRSIWGARIARAVHSAVAAGTAGWLDRNHPASD